MLGYLKSICPAGGGDEDGDRVDSSVGTGGVNEHVDRVEIVIRRQPHDTNIARQRYEGRQALDGLRRDVVEVPEVVRVAVSSLNPGVRANRRTTFVNIDAFDGFSPNP